MTLLPGLWHTGVGLHTQLAGSLPNSSRVYAASAGCVAEEVWYQGFCMPWNLPPRSCSLLPPSSLYQLFKILNYSGGMGSVLPQNCTVPPARKGWDTRLQVAWQPCTFSSRSSHCMPFYTHRGEDGSKSLVSWVTEVVLFHLFLLMFNWARATAEKISSPKPL